MHNNIPEISNGTVLSDNPLAFSSASASNSQPVGQGFTASVSGRANTIILNGLTMSDLKSGLDSVLSSLSTEELSSESDSGGVVVEKRVRSWQGDSQDSGMAILRELKVLISPSIRRHPNIVKLVAYTWEDSPTEIPRISPVLSLERAADSLAQFQSQAKLSYTQKRDIMLGISRGLSAR